MQEIIFLVIGVLTGFVTNQFLIVDESSMLRNEVESINQEFLQTKKTVNTYQELSNEFCKNLGAVNEK
jgi:hypothetical protein